MRLYLRNRFLEMADPVIMGILNVTPDSFSDKGKFYSTDKALKQAENLISDGADIIDVGGESTRPGAVGINVEEEIDRVIPVIEKIKEAWDIVVSIDTCKERVARLAVEEAGAEIVNDVSALTFSENMAETIARLDVPVVLMHMKGTPEKMQNNPEYTDVVYEIEQFFGERIDFAFSRGIKKEKIILDPGIGFGKRVEDNINIIKNLRRFLEFDMPLMVGLSRKSFLGKIGGEDLPENREAETIAANLVAFRNGATLLRVHHVKNAVKALKIFKSLT